MKGIYVLVISVERDFQVNVGALGILRFEKGSYAYVGSAQNCLEKRVRRHLGKDKKKFWHIGYLLSDTRVTIQKVLTQEVGKLGECKLADRLCRKGFPVPGFGCSDCKCKSHLFKIRSYEFLKKRMRETVVESF